MNDEDEIIRYADISMYQAKRKQECRLSFYNPEIDIIRKRLFNLQHDLNYAISREELELHYQPIIRATDGKIVAAEALIRWKHPRDGLLLPDRFLPIAIETGFIDEIGWWTLQKVCSEIERWRDAGLFHIEDISINMDAIQLQSIDFEEKFISILDRYGISPELIRVELTETSLIDNFEHSRKMIEAIRERGIRWSIDDFGTGYSSLSYLRKLSFSTLKIDREFIKDIENSTTDLFLVKEIVNIGEYLGYKIVIEGIENLKQYEEIGLVDENIYYQGFYFSRPLPAESFEKLYLRGM
jgi:EAL domain-containing protein (putative c-di-GMP-specific phosphodiesterase class I)